MLSIGKRKLWSFIKSKYGQILQWRKNNILACRRWIAGQGQVELWIRGSAGQCGADVDYKVRGVSADSQRPTRPRRRNPSSGVTTNFTWRRRRSCTLTIFSLFHPFYRCVPQLRRRNNETCRWLYRLWFAERKCRKSLPGGLPASSCSGRWPPGTVSEGHRCTLIRRHTLVPLVWGPPGTDRLEGDQELGASNTCLASNRFLPPVFASLFSVLAATNFPVIHSMFAFFDFRPLFHLAFLHFWNPFCQTFPLIRCSTIFCLFNKFRIAHILYIYYRLRYAAWWSTYTYLCMGLDGKLSYTDSFSILRDMRYVVEGQDSAKKAMSVVKRNSKPGRFVCFFPSCQATHTFLHWWFRIVAFEDPNDCTADVLSCCTSVRPIQHAVGA